MKRILLASILISTPAIAQQQRSYTPTADVLLHQALDCESAATMRISTLQGQVDALTKERDALKAKLPPEKTDEKK